jgi:hypothetical protein
VSTKENRHTKQEDRDEVKQYKKRKHNFEDDELFDEEELDPEIYDYLKRHLK